MSDTKEPDLPMVRVDNPFPLLDKMIERGTDPVALGQMMALAERWKEARAKEEFAVAMRACQEAMPVVVKDAKNLHTKSRYARLEEVNRVVKPCYTAHGFSISFGEADCPVEGHVRIIANVRHAGGCTEQYRIDMPMDGKGSQGSASAMNAPQAKVSTTTYGQRRLECMIFNVTVADEDTDGNVASEGELLTSAQIETINQLISELREMAAPFDHERFLAFMLGLEKGEERGKRTLADAPQERYGPGMESLTKKIIAAKARGK
jgi:hypothetical protein